MYSRIIYALLVFVVTFSVRAGELGLWDSFVPKSDVVNADIMTLGAPPEIQEIGVRIQQSLQKNSDWANEFMSNLKPGRPMPYHPNLGVSESEYKKFVDGVKTTQLIKVGETKLNFSIKDDTVVLAGLFGPSNSDLVVYNVKQDTVVVMDLPLIERSQINQTKKDSATGRWKGEQWKIESFVSNTNLTFVKFAIGKFIDRPESVIYVDIKIINGDERVRKSYFYILNGG
ncbi:hypothetical protein MACH09_39660 [Vibrio sp. MACH09]|uniref:hypothetical protein n=1 Tax=Vibrio sp. MACH09 TaxID=3025122 RepID=UPI002792DC09|nr:hypothetical protein [Vibrio sp. MACH09]GLO63458.1 hypothetical protein MACH09_39660 [Vibrio sp. MACH09]